MFLSIWVQDGSKYIFYVLKIIFHTTQKTNWKVVYSVGLLGWLIYFNVINELFSAVGSQSQFKLSWFFVFVIKIKVYSVRLINIVTN